MNVRAALASLPLTSAYLFTQPRMLRTTTAAAQNMARRSALTPFGPTSSWLEHRLQEMQDRQDYFRRQIEEQQQLLNRALLDLEDGINSGDAGAPFSLLPVMHSLSEKDTFGFSLDLPGMTEDDIHIQIDDERRLVNIHGQREMTKDGVSRVSKFSRTFTVNERAHLDELKATLENGVLTVKAPMDPVEEKVEEKEEEKEQLRRIPIDVVEGKKTITEGEEKLDLNKQEVKEKELTTA